MENDQVNKPKHYTRGIEVIDIMKCYLRPDEFKGFLKGNIIKYCLRANHKGKPLEDLKKANWYLNRLLKELDTNGNDKITCDE